jgi:Cgr1 family protein
MAESQENPGNIQNHLLRTYYTPCLYPLFPPVFYISRSHQQPGLKMRSFHDRMEKASKALAIKKLQAELKEEKQAEIQRYDLSVLPSRILSTLCLLLAGDGR